MRWEGGQLLISGKLSTAKEKERLLAWATEEGLIIDGDLASEAVISASSARLRAALTELVRKDIKDVGYLIYAVDEKGRGKVLSLRSEFEISKFSEIAKVPQVSGG